VNRHEFLKTVAAAAVSVVVPRYSRAAQEAAPKTYTYKSAGGCEIKADAYGSEASIRKPVIVWIHGGALIMGSRRNSPKWLDPSGEHVVISLDYRLAPETKLPAIIQDIQDAFRWVREQGPKLLHIDAERLAVAGGSAGAYLTLMTGFCVEPRPRALLSLSGYGDIAANWYTRPSSFYVQQPLVPEEVARKSMGTGCVSAPSADADNQRAKFYLYCRQKGIWPKEVSGHDPDVEPKWFDRYCPVRNVSAKYPPTVLIHGTADTDVPYEESVEMDAVLSRYKVEHRFLSVPGGDHGINSLAPPERARIFEQAMGFVREHTS